MTTPSKPARILADPRQIIGNPGDYAHLSEAARTSIFTLAWFAAKSQQGHPVIQSRHRPGPTSGPTSGEAA